MAFPSLRSRARTIALGIVNPQTQAIQTQINAERDRAQRESDQAFAVGQAIAKMTGDAYKSASDAQMSFAGALGGTVGDLARQGAAAAGAHIQGGDKPTSAYDPSVNPDAASGLATEVSYKPGQGLSDLGAAQVGALGDQALMSRNQALHAYDPEIATLVSQKLAEQGTLGAETEKAWLSLRDDQRQQAALGIQKQQANRVWQQALDTRALNLTNMTGSLWVVKNGHVVNTHQPAGGSAAASNYIRQTGIQATADAAAARLNEQHAHNVVMEGIDRSRIGISQQNANTAAKREAAYEKWLAAKGGRNAAQSAAYRMQAKNAGDWAYTFFYGKKNSAFDPNKGGGPGQKPNPQNPYYTSAPGSASDAMAYMIGHGIPYSIAWKAIYQYANMKGSHWGDALRWNVNYLPPAARNRDTGKPGPGVH